MLIFISSRTLQDTEGTTIQPAAARDCFFTMFSPDSYSAISPLMNFNQEDSSKNRFPDCSKKTRIPNLFPPPTLCTHEYYPHDPIDTLPRTRSGTIMRRVLEAEEMGIDPGDISGLEI